jgi:DNA-binding NtrC family response regulator
VVDQPLPELERLGPLTGSGRGMTRLFAQIQALARFAHPVLIVGESGTGKELAARALHDSGARRDGPFVPCNMAALTPELFESELFGHEEGAFSGATTRKDGLFHAADGGTLFLDEIGELALPLQAKLLRALENGEVRRVGAQVAEQPDVRVIAATNRDLQAMVADKTFRLDLYQRLAMTRLWIPPLRERMHDLPALALELLQRDNPGWRIRADALHHLAGHDWPGNVRELRGVLVSAVSRGGSNPLRPEDLEFGPKTRRHGEADTGRLAIRKPRLPVGSLEDERAQIVAALAEAGGNKREAERALGLRHSTFNYRLKVHGLG